MRLIRNEVPNFRPLGEGAIRPGMLYRSGSLSGLGPVGAEGLRALGVRTVIDLRSDEELTRLPAGLPGGIAYRSLPVSAGSAGGASAPLSDDETIERIKASYRGIVRRDRETIARVLSILAEPDALPAVICCTAGKDRTGVLSAILLLAVGITPEAVREDYDRTNRHLRGRQREMVEAMAGQVTSFAMPDGGVPDVMLRADPGYLEAAMQEIGNVPSFLGDIGVPDATLDTLRARLLS